MVTASKKTAKNVTAEVAVTVTRVVMVQHADLKTMPNASKNLCQNIINFF